MNFILKPGILVFLALLTGVTQAASSIYSLDGFLLVLWCIIFVQVFNASDFVSHNVQAANLPATLINNRTAKFFIRSKASLSGLFPKPLFFATSFFLILAIMLCVLSLWGGQHDQLEIFHESISSYNVPVFFYSLYFTSHALSQILLPVIVFLSLAASFSLQNFGFDRLIRLIFLGLIIVAVSLMFIFIADPAFAPALLLQSTPAYGAGFSQIFEQSGQVSAAYRRLWEIGTLGFISLYGLIGSLVFVVLAKAIKYKNIRRIMEILLLTFSIVFADFMLPSAYYPAALMLALVLLSDHLVSLSRMYRSKDKIYTI